MFKYIYIYNYLKEVDLLISTNQTLRIFVIGRSSTVTVLSFS